MLEQDHTLTRRALAWIHGFGRPSRPDEATEVDFIIDLVAGGPVAVVSYGKTKEAEENMGWPPSIYWYVGAVDDAFGETVIGEWNPPLNIFLSRVEGSAAPFDTGALAVVPARLEISGEDPIAYSHRHQVELRMWHAVIVQRLSAAYDTFASYVGGRPPNIPMSSRDHSGLTSDPRAWTWEARVAKDLVSDSVGQADHLYWRSEERRRIIESRLEDRFDADPNPELLRSQTVIASRSSTDLSGSHRANLQARLISREDAHR